jgi:hypothetical protein
MKQSVAIYHYHMINLYEKSMFVYLRNLNKRLYSMYSLFCSSTIT